ncbi:NADH-quinone oxidoreductase subunit N [Nibribacter ruber]|uniref:NADH-quinone oxidoreductase subunit N n=1 Tax=Nibribacter ruber TaxID=2698458 RepID=A0A6P1P462_9BACT|nr:NADH-quinone oxidoreductase subunit N [Nibribacter ruber]QHL89171.1 NADH-quinone oxidoreductase subunit N [Nibribacter ruber]
MPAPIAPQDTIRLTAEGLSSLGPECLLLLGFLLVLGLDLLPSPKLRSALPRFAFLVLLAVAVWQGLQVFGGVPFVTGSLLMGMLYQDGLALWGSWLFSSAAVLSLLIMGFGWKHETGSSTKNEFFAVLLAVVLGLNLLVRSSNLLMLFLSLELVSIGSYLLVLLASITPARVEAGVKYILYGMFASGVMLYGISFLYGLSGMLQFLEPAFWTSLTKVPLVFLTLVWGLVLAGILFKLAGFPFHFWAPDVYQTAPTGVVAFFSTAPKTAAVLVLLRFCAGGAETLNNLQVSNPSLFLLLQVAAVGTLVLGNFTALLQQDAKRLMAYSSIAHAGFLLLTLLLGADSSRSAVLFYVTVLLFSNMGFFLVIQLLQNATGSTAIEAWAGMGKKAPYVGALAVVFLLSLIGLPPTGGFVAKLLVFSQLWEGYQATGQMVFFLLLAGALFLTAVALYYYLKIPYSLFMRRKECGDKIKFPLGAYLFLALLCIPVLLFFFKADWLVKVLQQVLSL